MANFEIKDGVAIIPEGTRAINYEEFKDCTELKSVTIPQSVSIIGFCAFNGCSGLTRIVVEDGNPFFDSRDDCNAVIESDTNILYSGCQTTTIPASVESIQNEAFQDCTTLTSIDIPEGVELIGVRAFAGCTGLERVTIPASVAAIGIANFQGCTALTDVTIAEGVKEICREAFQDCTALKSIVLPKGMKRVDAVAFQGAISLETITLPTGMTKIDSEAFYRCTALKTIYVPAKKADYYKQRLPEELHQFIVEMEPVKKAKKK